MNLKKNLLYLQLGALFLIVLSGLFGLAYFTVKNVHREEQLMSSHLRDMGISIIRIIEAAAESEQGGYRDSQHLRDFFALIGRQRNYRYLLLITQRGSVVVSNIDSLEGQEVPGDILPVAGDSIATGLSGRFGQGPVFEVHSRLSQRAMAGLRRALPGLGDEQLYLIVGLGTDEFQSARHEDFRRALGTGLVLIILLVAMVFFAGVIRRYYKANQSLQQAESFIRNVIESMGHGLIALDAEGRILTINKRACDLLRFTEAEVSGRDFAEVMSHVYCSIDKGEIFAGDWTEKKVRCSVDGRNTHSVSLTTRRILDHEGNMTGTVIVMRDLQEIEELEQRVERSERLAGLGQMAAGIAHEVRNPLGSIKGLAQYFSRKFADEPDEKKYAEAIINETDRLNRVVSELLDFARPHEPDWRECTITAILDHALRLVQADLTARSIRVERSGEEQVPGLQADPDLLAQAFMNLFLNAAEAMEDGGVLTIQCSVAEQGEALIIAVEDNGKGIPQHALGDIFNPFFTLKKSGTGLGLALVHRIVDNHGGSIDVSSVEGRGTRFIIKLPVKA